MTDTAGRSYDAGAVRRALAIGPGSPREARTPPWAGAPAARGASRLRQMLGGSLRQAGVLAGAARYALAHHVDRLAADRAHAREFADRLAEAGLPVDTGAVETNFVFMDLSPTGLSRGAARERLAQEGVLWSNAHHPGILRAVTHLNIGAADIATAVDRTIRAIGAARGD